MQVLEGGLLSLFEGAYSRVGKDLLGSSMEISGKSLWEVFHFSTELGPK